MAIATTVLVSTATGWLLWTLTEYLVHRFAFHRRLTNWFSRLVAGEHTKHHREPEHTNLALRVIGHLGVAAAGLPFAILLSSQVGLAIGLATWIGWAGGYVVYETSHWLFHHRPPSNRRGLIRRRRHLLHHCVDARSNFGVTVGWWDVAFKTSRPADRVAIHPKLAPSWLIDKPNAHAGLELLAPSNLQANT